MKTIILIIGLIVGLTSLTLAQNQKKIGDKNQVQTLFGFDSKITGYSTLESKFSTLNGRDALLIGGQRGDIYKLFLIWTWCIWTYDH